MLAGLDTGAFVIAQSKLLKNRRATVHYEHIDALRENYPEIDVVENLFTVDESLLSCSGGTASVGLALHILKRLFGAALANATARHVVHPRLRDHGTGQRPTDSEPLGATVPTIVNTAVMENNLEDPMYIPQICAAIGMSQRQLDRLFARHIRKSPTLEYRDIRLDRARGLVTQTELPMSEIAVASGFSGQVHFSRA